MGANPAMAGFGEYVAVANQQLSYYPDDGHDAADFGLWRSDGSWSVLPDIPAGIGSVALAENHGTLLAAVAACGGDSGCSAGGRIEFWTLSPDAESWDLLMEGPEFDAFEAPPIQLAAASPRWSVFAVEGDGLSLEPTVFAVNIEQARVSTVPDWTPGEDERFDGIGMTTCVNGDVLFGVSVGYVPVTVSSSESLLPIPADTPYDVRTADLSGEELVVAIFDSLATPPIPGLVRGGCAGSGVVFLGEGTETRVPISIDGVKSQEGIQQTADAVPITNQPGMGGGTSPDPGISDLVTDENGVMWAIDPLSEQVMSSGGSGSWSTTGFHARSLVATASNVVALTRDGLEVLVE